MEQEYIGYYLPFIFFMFVNMLFLFQDLLLSDLLSPSTAVTIVCLIWLNYAPYWYKEGNSKGFEAGCLISILSGVSMCTGLYFIYELFQLGLYPEDDPVLGLGVVFLISLIVVILWVRGTFLRTFLV